MRFKNKIDFIKTEILVKIDITSIYAFFCFREVFDFRKNNANEK